MQKVAHYRRAVWLEAGGPTLEVLIRGFLDLCPDVAATQFEYKSDIDVQVAERSIVGQGVGIYLTLYSEGRRAATVQNGGAGVNRRPAPQGEEFLKTGIVIVIQGNDVAYIADGHTNDAQITNLFHSAFRSRNFPEVHTQFVLTPRMNEAQLQAIIQRGVKSIDLGLSSFNSSIEQLNETGEHNAWLAPLVAVRNAMANAFGADKTPAEQEAASLIEASIHLGYDRRNRNELIPRVLSSLARGVEEHGSQFKIVTIDDLVITHDKLVIRAEINVDGDEVAIEAQSAFVSLRQVMSVWRATGIFDQ